ncbi:hypothetical protein ALT_0515 [Aspergillus lentulus]|uniref:Uncharacterized protein n=1 Tax=Aspergillus lentulus TaxID=293939 RepID=A0AAN4T6Z5_ASPLE|nr:hypothetical protein ALT_0515 [Aspergillus lentulus]
MSPLSMQPILFKELLKITIGDDWDLKGPAIAVEDNLLIQCGYDVHKQYQYLAFFHRHVLPVLGPFIRSSLEANYSSGFSAEGYPMELSLNYQASKATVQLGCEPIGEFTGTSQDPMNP